MRHIVLWTLFLSLLMVVCSFPLHKPTTVALPVSTVDVLAGEDEHGSGTHIGGGIVLTANHVVGDKKTVRVKTENGRVTSATVYWTSPLFDVALIKSDEMVADVSTLDCSLPVAGSSVHARGNPSQEEFVTTWGYISNKAQNNELWKDTWLINMAIIPGMSGGGVFDNRERIVGMTVGVMVIQMGPLSHSMVGLGYMVPASTICTLLGR